jgi:uncharacterized linocin/CFP29 family protein
MDHLRRDLAPISDKAWHELDEEAARDLRNFLAARRVVDFSGPHGWAHSADNVGRLERVEGPQEGVEAGMRTLQALVELRTPFRVSRSDLDDIDRGRPDPDLTAVLEAARKAAAAEDRLVFHGFKAGGIVGMAEASPHPHLEIGDEYSQYPKVVAQAAALLRNAGVDGPYAMALGNRSYTGVIETTEYGGYPVLEHIRLILGGPVVWAPAVDCAVVASVRGGDFELTCGQDFAVGYTAYDGASVELYLEESVTFRVLQPEAAVCFSYSYSS